MFINLLRKRIFLCIIFLLVVGLTVSLVGCASDSGESPPAPAAPAPAAPAPAPEKTHDFIFAHPFPGGHPIMVGVIEPFVEEIKEKSGGRINITVHPGGAVSTSASVIEDTISGAIDMGWTLQGYTPGKYPLTGLIELPFMWNSATEATTAFWNLFEESDALQEEYNEVKVFNLYATDVGEIYTNKPIRSLSDLAGVQIRGASAMVETALNLFGAAPISMPMPDVYDALERGVVEGVATPPSAVNSYKLFEVTKYGTKGLNLYVSPQVFFMNWDSWNSLSPADQELFDRLSGEKLALMAAEVYEGASSRSIANMAENGVEIYTLSAAEAKEFQDKAAAVAEDYIGTLEGQGLAGRKTYDQMMSIRKGL